MQVKQIAIIAAIATSFAAPLTAQASDIATLNGWGALFAAAHAGQQASAQGNAQSEIKVSLFQRQQPPAAQPAPEAAPAPAPIADMPEMNQPEPGDQKANVDNKTGEAASAGQDSAGQAMTNANASLSAAVNLSGEQLGQVLGKVDGLYQTAGSVVEGVTGGVLGTVQNVVNMTSGASVAADLASSGSMNIAGLASANLAGSLGATASLLNAGQLGAITAVTSSVIQNVLAARPASLTGLLR